MKKRNRQLQQQIDDSQQDYVGGIPQHILGVSNNDNDILSDIDDLPILTPTVPNLETTDDIVTAKDVNEIVIPQTIQELEEQKVVQQIKQITDEQQFVIKVLDANQNVQQEITIPKRLSKFKSIVKDFVKPAMEQQKNQQVVFEQDSTQAVQVAQDLVNNVLQSIDSDIVIDSAEDVEELIETIVEVSESLEDIPEGDKLSMDSLVIVDNSKTKGDKTGYKKFKVTIKNVEYGKLVSDIASRTKRDSNGLVEHRVSDLRVISNTNRKFLSDSELQLSPLSFTFKPKGGIVNKSTRIILSIPDDYNDTGEMLIFIQKSRDKSIHKISVDSDEDVDWLSKFMGNYFNMEYKMANSMLKIQDRSNPINEVMRDIIKTGSFKVSPRIEKDKIKGFTVKTSLGGKAEWLKVGVVQVTNSTDFVIYLMSDLDKDWYKYIQPNGNREVSFKYIQDNLLSLLLNLFSKDNWEEYGVDVNDEETRDEVMMHKLTYRNLKKVYIDMYSRYISESFEKDEDDDDDGVPEEIIGINIIETLSQADTKKSIGVDGKGKSYAAESIIGKTSKLKYFILTYLGVQIVGDDKRNGKDYITSEQYYEKYGVRDRRQYEDRQRTVIKKEDSDRNYNTRVFMFQLEYKIGDKSYVFRSKDFEEIKDATGFLTTHPKPTKEI